MFIKNRGMIEDLIGEREMLIANNNSQLIDTIVLPINFEKLDDGKYTQYTSIDEWFKAASAKTDILKKNDRSDYDTGQVKSDEVDAEFYKKQKDLYNFNKKMRENPSYSFPSEAPSRRGLPEEQKSMKQLPNYNDEGDLVADPLEVEKDAEKPAETTIAPTRSLPVRSLQRSKRNRTIKRNRTRRMNRKRNNSKNGGSSKKRTTRNKWK
jgi:hypothetical protein